MVPEESVLIAVRISSVSWSFCTSASGLKVACSEIECSAVVFVFPFVFEVFSSSLACELEVGCCGTEEETWSNVCNSWLGVRSFDHGVEFGS